MGKRIQLNEAPFTNEFGDVINPGDSVIVVTDRFKSVKINKGTYLGLNNTKVVVSIPSQRWTWNSKTQTGGWEDVMHRSHLIKNRIYPTTMALSQFAGKRL